MTEADGEQPLEMLYRIIDVDNGLDKMEPENTGEFARLMQMACMGTKHG